MNRRRWLTVAFYLVSPLLVFTFLTAVIVGGHVLDWSSNDEQSITNRTPVAIRVTPLLGETGPLAPHHSNRWGLDSNPQLHHIAIPPGETRRIIVDRYVHMDHGGPLILVVRSADGRAGFKEVGSEDVVIDNFDSLKYAHPSMLYAADIPPGDVNNRLLAVVVGLGVGTPIVMWWLRRAARRLRFHPEGVGQHSPGSPR